MIKAILFDIDGVVVTSEKVFSERLMEEYGAAPESLSKFFDGIFLECLVGRADLKEEIKEYINEWGWKGTVDELLDYWFRNESQADGRVLTAIRELRKDGKRCYFATNQEKYRTEYLTNQMNFKTIFDGGFSSAHIGCLKNNSQYFRHILKELEEFQPEEILFWDDSSDNIDTAITVGIQAHIYENFEDFQSRISKYFKVV